MRHTLARLQYLSPRDDDKDAEPTTPIELRDVDDQSTQQGLNDEPANGISPIDNSIPGTSRTTGEPDEWPAPSQPQADDSPLGVGKIESANQERAIDEGPAGEGAPPDTEQVAESIDSVPEQVVGTDELAQVGHEFVEDATPEEMDQYRRIRETNDLDALAETAEHTVASQGSTATLGQVGPPERRPSGGTGFVESGQCRTSSKRKAGIVPDTAACERLLARLVAANWDDDEAEDRHAASRGRLAVEYLRRTAAWADALGVPTEWPFFDLAVVLDPSVETDPVWMERLQADSGHKLWTLSREVVTDMFRWASLGDRPKERFPNFDDPYEPMIQLLERGGEIWPGHGSIEFYLGSVPYRGIADRLSQTPLPIDAPTLDALDEDYRIGAEESRAGAAAQRAAKQEQPPTRESQ